MFVEVVVKFRFDFDMISRFAPFYMHEKDMALDFDTQIVVEKTLPPPLTLYSEIVICCFAVVFNKAVWGQGGVLRLVSLMRLLKIHIINEVVFLRLLGGLA